MQVYFLNQYHWRNGSYVQSAEVEKETDCFYWTKNDTNYKCRSDRREKSDCFLTKQDAINKLLEKYRQSVSRAQDRLKEAESDLSKIEEWARQNTIDECCGCLHDGHCVYPRPCVVDGKSCREGKNK